MAVDGIKQLLEGLNVSTRQQSHVPSVSDPNHANPIYASQAKNMENEPPLRKHSVPVCRFVDDVVAEGGLKYQHLRSNDVLDSLRDFARPRDEGSPERVVRLLRKQRIRKKSNTVGNTMPPLEAAVFILRWARGMFLAP